MNHSSRENLPGTSRLSLGFRSGCSVTEVAGSCANGAIYGIKSNGAEYGIQPVYKHVYWRQSGIDTKVAVVRGEAMAKRRNEPPPEALLARVQAIVNSGITAMSKDQFKEFDESSRETIAEIKASAHDCESLAETESGLTEVLHA